MAHFARWREGKIALMVVFAPGERALPFLSDLVIDT